MLAIQKGDLFRINSAVSLHLFVHELFSIVEDLIKLSTTENQTSGLHNSYYAANVSRDAHLIGTKCIQSFVHT